MKKINIIVTAIYGAFWLVFGLNGFLDFFAPPPPSGEGAAFMQALESAGYVMPLIYASQIIAGLMLLSRRFIPLALLILTPVIANILLYDVFLNMQGLAVGAVIGLLYAILLIQNKRAFTIFLKP